MPHLLYLLRFKRAMDCCSGVVVVRKIVLK